MRDLQGIAEKATIIDFFICGDVTSGIVQRYQTTFKKATFQHQMAYTESAIDVFAGAIGV